MSKTDLYSMGRLKTGIANLDAVLGGGLPKGSMTVIAGPPGSGKTILSHQIGFHNAGPGSKVIYFQTLGEPTSKRLQYLSQFSYFDADKFDDCVHFIDLSVILRAEGIEPVIGLIMDHVKREKPSIVVVDSFKAFEDLVTSQEEHRKFTYEIIVNLIAWECTVLLLGEFGEVDFRQNPLFSVIDGVITMTQMEVSGEQLRMLRVVKMRGTDHNRDYNPFLINSNGVHLFAPRVVIQCTSLPLSTTQEIVRCKTGMNDFDDLLSEGLPEGASILVAGATGTGKTVMLLDFVYKGAVQFGEKGIFFSFEETKEKLCQAALGLGWDLDALINKGLIDIVFIPQPAILVEEHLLMMRERSEAMGAKRIAVDSLSRFLYKIQMPQLAREKVYQLATIVQNLGAIGIFSSEVSYGSNQISRFGFEETMVDGVIILSLIAEGFQRKRYLEIHKLRHTAHSLGQYQMTIEQDGVKILRSMTKNKTKSKNLKQASEEKTHERKKNTRKKARAK